MADDKPAFSTVEAFVDRLNTLLSATYSGRGSSVTGDEPLRIGVLQQCITRAKVLPGPNGDDYPRWLYRDGQQRSVESREAEEAAVGWSRTPEPPSYVPRWFTERPRALGGEKIWDLRSVLIRSSDEEELLRKHIEAEDWVPDNQRAWGGRGISLAEIIAERTELLHKMLDADLAAEPAAAGAPADQEAQPAPADEAAAAPAEAEEESR